MPDSAFVLTGCRTPIGTANRGSLVDVDPYDLALASIEQTMVRLGEAATAVEDVIVGEGQQGGGVAARHAAVRLGLTHLPGMAVNRHCAGGLAAVQAAAAQVMSGANGLVVAGGTHSGSIPAHVVSRRRPGGDDTEQWMAPSHPATPDAPADDMSITVGWNTAQIAGLSREEMDRWALRSHERAVAGIDSGAFADEIVPLEIRTRDGRDVVFDTDEHPRRDSSMERLARLKPIHPEIPGFSITAGNASGVNDGAATVAVGNRRAADAMQGDVLARIVGWASVGVDPRRTGLAPLDAVPRALAMAERTVSDVSLFEINEAFASVAIAVTRGLGVPEDKVNVLGSGCSLGHPIAASGTRMLLTLAHELRRRGGGLGVVTMCAGGGMGSALVIEVG